MSFPLVSPKEWVNFLLKFDVQKESQVKKIALILYYARIACYSNCDSMITFLAMDDHSVIKKYIKEIIMKGINREYKSILKKNKDF